MEAEDVSAADTFQGQLPHGAESDQPDRGTRIAAPALRPLEDDLLRMIKVFIDAADPIIIEDLAGRIIDLNNEAEQTYGWPRQELIGRRASELVPADQLDAEMAFLEKCRRGEKVRSVESVRQAKDGSQHAVLLTYSLLGGDDGQPLAIATIAKDISERKRSESEARMGVRRRDQFLAMLSHELRNPLAAVLSASQVIQRASDDPVMVGQACDIIQRQARQAARLLDDLLDIGRLTQGKLALKTSALDLVNLVNDAAGASRRTLQARRHRLNVDLPNESLTVSGDPARLLQIMENLLTNAAKYTPLGGQIDLRLFRDRSQAVIEVADTGIGIAPQHLEEVFGLFIQLDPTMDGADRGLGIGLSMVRMLVEMHGGTVTARSDGLGRGSRFTVRLPAVEAAPAAAGDGCDGQQVTPVSVLIVEDIADSRTVLRRLLSLDGHDVREAADGHQGLAALLSNPPDVALVDVGLPGIDGFEVARIARKNPALSRVRLVALTGYGRPEDRKALLDAGFDEHLVKPVHPSELTRVLKPRAESNVTPVARASQPVN